MTAFVRALAENVAKIRDAETLNWLMIVSAAGLLVSLLYLINGIDIAGGF